MFTLAGSAKIRRLRRDPRAALSIAESVGVAEAWVSVEGIVEFGDDLQRTRDFGCQLAERYYELLPDRAKEVIEEWSKADDLVLLEMKPIQIRSLWGPYVKE